MSAVVVLSPVVAAAWPVVSAVAAGALASLGYAASRRAIEKEQPKSVTLELENAKVLVEGARDEAGPLVFRRGDVTLEVVRGEDGGCRVQASGCGHPEEELRGIAREAIDRIVQGYAYHRLVSELKQRNFEVVEESVEEDRSIKIRVRQWKA